MKRTICSQVRLEIDEKNLTESLSATSVTHVQQCSECREFQNKQTKLRQIVASLETVSAPPDFDFKLRARLATAHGSDKHLLASPVRVWRLRSLAIAAMLLIFAVTLVMIRQSDQTYDQATKVDQLSNTANENTAARQPETPTTASPVASQADESSTPEVAQKPAPKRVGPQPPTNKRSTVAVDFSGTGAPVVRDQQSLATMPSFPLNVSQHPFTVSLDDGHGSSRTISVPAVSFGSRRVLTSGNMPSNQFAPKGDW